VEEPRDERLGTRREFELRDDDRPAEASYSRRRSMGFVVLILAAVLLIGGAAAYLSYFGDGQPRGASVPAPGPRP
jgi:flagellar basal body-associated protein FliL